MQLVCFLIETLIYAEVLTDIQEAPPDDYTVLHPCHASKSSVSAIT